MVALSWEPLVSRKCPVLAQFSLGELRFFPAQDAEDLYVCDDVWHCSEVVTGESVAGAVECSPFSLFGKDGKPLSCWVLLEPNT